MTTADVCVVGGGPSGALFSILMRRAGRTVVLFDDQRRSKPRIETLSPTGARLLREHDLHDCLLASGAIRSSGLLERWSSARLCTARSSISNAVGSAWHIDRSRFDAVLRRRAESIGVQVIEARVASAAPSVEGYLVSAPLGSIACRDLVDATGSAAPLGRRLRLVPRVLDRQLALSVRLDHRLAEPALVLLSVASGWLYLTPCGDNATQATLVTDTDIVRGETPRHLMAAALQDFDPTLALDWASCAIQISPVLLQVAPAAAPPRFRRIGDAAWSPDPLSGEGVAEALQSAIHAAGEPLSRFSPAQLALAHLRQRSAFYRNSAFHDAPYYRNRLRAAARVEEDWHGHPL